jgi:hypothetical protein
MWIATISRLCDRVVTQVTRPLRVPFEWVRIHPNGFIFALGPGRVWIRKEFLSRPPIGPKEDA